MKENKKLMICLRREGKKGKTGTIKALAEMLIPDPAKALKWHNPETPPVNWASCYGDICVVVKVKGKIVGLSSHGDWHETIKEELKFLKNKNCDIIFCTCRTKGKTRLVVNRAARTYGYTLITTAPYTIETIPATNPPDETAQKAMNQKKAEHLETFI